MKSILTTYPDFQRLPKGVKQMLLESETFFFHEFEPAARIESHSRPEFAKGLYPNSDRLSRQPMAPVLQAH
jgi:hypothetical protein